MLNLLERFENFLLALCTLSDNSFFKLFGIYVLFILMYHFSVYHLEIYLDFEPKVMLYDLIFIVALFAIFAWNSYLLHKVKVKTGTPSFQVKNPIPGDK